MALKYKIGDKLVVIAQTGDSLLIDGEVVTVIRLSDNPDGAQFPFKCESLRKREGGGNATDWMAEFELIPLSEYKTPKMIKSWVLK